MSTTTAPSTARKHGQSRVTQASHQRAQRSADQGVPADLAPPVRRGGAPRGQERSDWGAQKTRPKPGFDSRPFRSGLVARRERPCSLRAESRLCCRGCRGLCSRGRGSRCGRSLLRSGLLASSLLGSGLLGSSLFRCSLLGSSLFRRGLLGSNLLRRSLLGSSLLGRRLLGSNLLRRSLLGSGLLGRRLLGRSLLHCCLLGRGLLCSGLLSGGFLSRSFLRSCHDILLDQVAKAPADSGHALFHRLFTV
jgi:hypothetical protein